LEAIQNRIKELNTGHFMYGSWHNWFGECPHCKTVQKLKDIEKQLTRSNEMSKGAVQE
jgi:exopolysaccharide biosynthesis predicted pyruvyltransferase EpsI